MEEPITKYIMDFSRSSADGVLMIRLAGSWEIGNSMPSPASVRTPGSFPLVVSSTGDISLVGAGVLSLDREAFPQG